MPILRDREEMKRINQITNDAINHPPHYTKGKIEVSDFIIDQKLDFCEGNVVKYVCRWKDKNGIQDLKKAQWYLNRKIKEIEGD